MNEKIIACDNVLCVKRSLCLRFFMFKSGEAEYKTFNGNAKKPCGKFIEIKKDI